MVGARQMTEQVTVAARTEVLDGQGGQIVTWTTVASDIWAHVLTPTLTVERLAALQVSSIVTRIVTVWYQTALASVSVKSRITWGSRTLEVQSVDDLENRHEQIQFSCLEVQA